MALALALDQSASPRKRAISKSVGVDQHGDGQAQNRHFPGQRLFWILMPRQVGDVDFFEELLDPGG